MFAELGQAHADGGLAELQTLRGLGDAAGAVQLPNDRKQFQIDIIHEVPSPPAAKLHAKQRLAASIVPNRRGVNAT